MADASQNNPKKELMFALVGTLAFLGIVLLIGVSGFLRPAQEHVVTKTAAEDAVTVEGEQVGTEVSNPEQAELDSSAAEQEAVVSATDEEVAQSQPAVASDAPDTSNNESAPATVTAQAGTATATATVGDSAPDATKTDDTAAPATN